MKNYLLILSAAVVLASCTEKSTPVVWVSTGEQTGWNVIDTLWETTTVPESLDVIIDPEKTAQTIRGFGTCFNELGWISLGRLSAADRDSVLSEMFEPGKGAGFTYCRMPIGANDFAVDWYSYNETEGDFEMRNFSIENDMKTLVPFIKAALKYNPDLEIWASPWSPPSWMKYNRYYALSWSWTDDPRYANEMTEERLGMEGTDMFIQKPEYMQAYALYFSKFIDAYRQQGIRIFGVAPQNEFNSCQPYPSCTWTARGLREFIGKYLGPAMAEKKVDVIFGTVERANVRLVDTVLQDSDCMKYVKTVAFQWAGKGAIPEVHERYPEMTLIQSESECGDGRNEWSFCLYTWDMMKHYLSNGASAYEYWNTSLSDDGMSRWGWRQNSLVVVNEHDKSFRFTHEYYLMKHFSRFVRPGAKRVETSGYDDLLAFLNADGSLAVVAVNKGTVPRTLSIQVGDRVFKPTLAAGTINSFVF